MKICRTCGIEKTEESFAKTGKATRRLDCKPCYNLAQRVYAQGNPEKIRKQWREASRRYVKQENVYFRRRLTKYGMTEEEYHQMYDRQDGKCAICKLNRQLVIDHCHDTLKVRGLLCNSCNLAIGYFEDNVASLKEAIFYLDAE